MKKQNKFVKISQSLLIVCLLTIGLTGMTGIAAASTGQYTGCLSTMNPSKGAFYNFQAGTTSLTDCKKGDITVSFYDKTYVDSITNSLETKVTALETLLAGVTRNGADIDITGANLHILSGSGSTDSTPNGLGNLIIGYNELRYFNNIRTGSHNLVLGSSNNYASYGGLVAGKYNEILGPFASVSGGQYNTASGYSSSVSGGLANTASYTSSSVSGGASNRASGDSSSVSGGDHNEASGLASLVSGGVSNRASGPESSVSGGQYDTASGDSSSVSGGHLNQASGNYSSNSGGYGYHLSNNYGWSAGSPGTLTQYEGQFFHSSSLIS